MLQLKQYTLPHNGVIPGARGHKKIIVPAGTKVYCIVYGTLIFWCAYLRKASAMQCLKGITDTIEGRTKRTIDINTLVQWNFHDRIPTRIHREKDNA